MQILVNGLASRLKRTLAKQCLTGSEGYTRLLMPMLVVLMAKLVSSVFFYLMLNMSSSETYWMTVNWDTEGQNEIMKTAANTGLRWPYLFLGWDSAWYLSIVTKGYAFSDKSFAFFPGLPSLSWVLNLILNNPSYALVLLSFILGVLWIPFFQLFAENHMDKPRASKSTVFFAFFPYVFLFTTVAYSEGLFLFSTLAAWYFFRREKVTFSMLFASVASVSRGPGVLILIPIGLEMMRRYRNSPNSFPKRKFLYLLAPLLCLLAWFIYCQTVFNTWIPSGWEGMYPFRVLVLNILPEKGIQGLFENFAMWPYSFTWVLFVLVTPFLIYSSVKLDRVFAAYLTAYYLGALAVGGLASIPRFLSFAFPMWLPLTSKLFSSRLSSLLAFAICVMFFVMGLVLWSLFLSGEFVG